MELRKILRAGVAMAIVLLGACGGGGSNDNGGGGAGGSGNGGGGGPGNTPPGIGAAGGTVNGPGGAKVVVPANALAQNTAIEVAQSNAGAPPLPAGVTAVGSMFAFTPHGTSFSTPATVTIPFDPAQVPTGATVALYKTNPARTGWEVVNGATANAGLLTGQVTGFSNFVGALVPPNPQAVPVHDWLFEVLRSDDTEMFVDEEDDPEDKVAGGWFDQQYFGPVSIAPQGHNLDAIGEVYSSDDGFTYWVLAEAPLGRVRVADDQIGARTTLYQHHFFTKTRADATLRFIVTQARIQAIDNNGTGIVLSACPWVGNTGRVDLCPDETLGELDLSFALSNLNVYPDGYHRSLSRVYQGIARLWGTQDNWTWSVSTEGAYRKIWSTQLGDVEEILPVIPIFNEEQFEYSIENGAAPNTDAAMRLAAPVVVEIDLSDIDVGDTLMLETQAIAMAHNRRGRESFVAAYLRDPASASGLTVKSTGLERVPPVGIVAHVPLPEPNCSAPADSQSGTIQFSEAGYSLPEFGKTSRIVRITRTGGSRGDAVVRLTTSDGTALAGTHYRQTTRLIYFGDGDTLTREVKIPIINDTLFTGATTFGLTLTAVNNCANIGTPGTAVVTILDDETPPPGTFVVGGSVTGLSGTGLILQDIITGSQVTPTSSGGFAFGYAYDDGAAYNVRIITQPTNPIQVCSVANGTGTIASADVNNVVVTCTTPAASGLLDPTFGSGGKVTTGLAGGARAMAIQGDGKILALGEERLGRYNANGSVDTSFGTSGEIAVTFSGALVDEAQAIAVQADGKILVAGFGRNGSTPGGLINYDFAISRYNTDGTLDTTFGTSGHAFAGSNLGTDRAYAVLLQPDGKIVLAGHMLAPDGADHDFAAARFLSTGALDTSFGTGGVATVSVAAVDFAYAAALQADGAILVAGETSDSTSDAADVGVARFTSAGVVDATFGTSGTVRIDYTGVDSDDQAESIAVQSDGKIVLAGSYLSSTFDFLLARLNADGTRDTAFGSNGLVTTAFGTGFDLGKALALQSDGAIVVAGSASSTTVSDFGLARYLASGALDTSFGTGGILTADFFGASDGAEAVAIQPDGKIVAAGVTRNGVANGVGVLRMQ